MKNLPIGISDFKKLIEKDCYYVDKTLLVKEVIESSADVLLLPRPRRFGKTLNMSMLKCFFEKTEKSNSYLFENTQIWQEETYRELQGQYPVIYLTFKDTKELTWQKTYESLVDLIAKEFRYHTSSINSDVIVEPELALYNNIKNGCATETNYKHSLSLLSELLFRSTGKRVIILIDEYDVPIHAGYVHGYYPEAISFIRSLLSAALKDNSYLEKGILTGILMVAKEGVFSELNNLSVYTILDAGFQDKFGFTEQEVQKLLQDYQLHTQAAEIQDWYNGYKFGHNTIYNPWSLLWCAANKGLIEPYWVNTSDNELIKNFLAKAGIGFKDDLELLLTGQSVEKVIEKKLVFSEIEADERALWTLLLFTGYLTYQKLELIEGYVHCDLVIPNKEIKFLYKDFLAFFLRIALKSSTSERLLLAIRTGDITTFSILLQEFVANSMSMYDLPAEAPERSYHLFMLGLLVLLSDEYQVKSNRESGYGRYDILLIPRDKTKFGYVIEFKKVIAAQETLEDAAQRALEQIKVKQYVQELRDLGVTNIVLLGIGCKGKELLVIAE